MKNFFKYMWYGIKASCKENRNLILMFIFGFGSIGISAGICSLFTDNDGIILLVGIIGFFLGIFLLVHYIHFLEANDYAKEHNVPFDIAWKNTEADGEDCF